MLTPFPERVQDLETAVADLEGQLSEQAREANEAIGQWERKCDSLQKTVLKKMEVSKRKVGDLVFLLSSEADLMDELLCMIDTKRQRATPLTDLHADLSLEDDKSFQAFKSSLGLAVKACENLRSQVRRIIAERESAVTRSEDGEEMLRLREEEIALLSDQVKDLAKKTKEQETSLGSFAETRDVLGAVQAELRAEQELTKSLRQEIKNQREKLSEQEGAIAARSEELVVTQGKLEAVGLQNSELESELQKHVFSLANVTEAESHLSKKLTESENALADAKSRAEMLMSEKARVEEALEAERQLASENEARWKEESSTSEVDKRVLEEKISSLHLDIDRLEEELQQTNDTIQIRITDEVSLKATEMATRALRGEVLKSRSEIESLREDLTSERNERRLAEQMVSKLQSDIRIVLGVSNDEKSMEKVKGMVLKASEHMQRKERKEIEELRKALDRAMQELSTARAAEKDAGDQAAAARLQLTASKQELLAAKSDLNFLSQNLEEMRESEATRIASFEYRISALEDDKDVVRRFHADELETLRNELAHLSMEKDRILHSLRESEKNNAALVYATSKERDSGEVDNHEDELARLRASNAQLLTAAGEEGSKTERRIREAVAASASLVEADVILERELRSATEAALDDLKAQIATKGDTASAVQGGTVLDRNESGHQDQIEELRAQLGKSREQSRKVAGENSDLRNELQRVREELETQVEQLTSKWQEAQVRVHQIEREVGFDAAVNLEMSRLQPRHPSEPPENWIVVSSPTKHTDNAQSHADVCDFVLEQKMAIQEERQMYRELMSEHEDLLALLAQLDLEKSSLNAALIDVAGKETADATLREAQENAVKQFGRYVRIA